MQTKALLLAAALASPALAASPSPIDARFASSCTSAASSVIGAFSALPEPTGALSTYLDAAASSASDPCSWVAAAPTSLSSEVSSFSSRVSELAVANSAALSQLAACATAIGEGEGAAAAAAIVPFLHITDCKAPAPTGVPTASGSGSGSKNAAPAQTGVAAAAGMAAAALVGVAGLL